MNYNECKKITVGFLKLGWKLTGAMDETIGYVVADRVHDQLAWHVAPEATVRAQLNPSYSIGLSAPSITGNVERRWGSLEVPMERAAQLHMALYLFFRTFSLILLVFKKN